MCKQKRVCFSWPRLATQGQCQVGLQSSCAASQVISPAIPQTWSLGGERQVGRAASSGLSSLKQYEASSRDTHWALLDF